MLKTLFYLLVYVNYVTVGKWDVRVHIMTDTVLKNYINQANFYTELFIEKKTNSRLKSSVDSSKLNQIQLKKDLFNELLSHKRDSKEELQLEEFFISNICEKIHFSGAEEMESCKELVGSGRNSNLKNLIFLSDEFIESSIESIPYMSNLGEVFSAARLREERLLEIVQKTKNEVLKSELNVLSEILAENMVIESWNLVSTASIVAVTLLVTFFKYFRKEKKMIIQCRKSLSLLPDDLLLSNPYILKFYKSNLKY